MASWISTGASSLCRLLGASTNAILVRSPCVRVCLVPVVRRFSTDSDGPPKVPPTGYIRFLKQQQTVLAKQYPDARYVDLTKKIALQWHALMPEQKKHFEEAARAAREKYREELARFQKRLSPEERQALLEDKRQKRAKRRAIRMKRELTLLGKPKRPRTAFNIFMSEHFLEARGVTMQGKMKSLVDDWGKLDSSFKQTYEQLAEDDRIRYAHEMESWEKYVTEIGRGDLVRRKAAPRKPAAGSKAADQQAGEEAVRSVRGTAASTGLKKHEE